VAIVVALLWPTVRAADWRFGPRVEIEPGAGLALGAGLFVAYLPLEPLAGLRLGLSAYGGGAWPVEGVVWTAGGGVHAVFQPVFARTGWWGETGARGDATGPFLAAGATGILDRSLDWALEAWLGLDLFRGEARVRLGAMLLLSR
jgi:hypothetical protein